MSGAEAAVEGSIQELREVNRMVYLHPDNASLIDKRTLKSYNFSSSSYTAGQTAQCILNSGGDALWGPTSYVRFEFTKDAGTIGKGSVLSFIKNIRLTHRSGEVLEYVQNANVLGRIKLLYGMNRDDSAKVSELLKVEGAAGTYVRMIPLHMLLGVFGNQDQYIPPGMLAGAKIEIDLEENAIAFAAAGTLTDVKLNVVVDSAQVYDSVQKQLIDEQADVAQSGIQFSYSTWFASSALFSGSSVNFDIQQSASITEKVCATIRTTASLVAGSDSFLYLPSATQEQWRLGSQYFPQQALKLTAAEQSEAYLQALTAWDASPMQYAGATASGRGAAATLAGWVAVALGVPTEGEAVYSQTLEKSSVGLQLTGEPTNNSRILNLEMLKPAAAERVDVFLQYLRVANLMGDNLVVDR
jgi:hypothetical protein